MQKIHEYIETEITFIENELVSLDRDLVEACKLKEVSKQAEMDFIYLTGQRVAYNNMLYNIKKGQFID